MVKISILGSTGNIGQQTLDVIRTHRDKFQVIALSTNKNIHLLKKQILEFKPQYVCIAYPHYSHLELKKALQSAPQKYKPVLYSGNEGLNKLATLKDADLVFIAVCGFSGVVPTLEAIKTEKVLAIANKEVFVSAGELIKQEIKKKYNTEYILHTLSNKGKIGKIFPVDSEHSAIYQCLIGEKVEKVKRVILTCSGGPFRNFPRSKLSRVKFKDVLKHPVWKMGKKIMVDSATLMNKSFEIIETHYLYNIPYENIKVIIHPEAIIHSMVEFIDGNLKALLSNPDMKIPIQYALFNGKREDRKGKGQRAKGKERRTKVQSEKELIHFSKHPNAITDCQFPAFLSFEEPDLKTFPCLRFGFEVGKAGGTLPAVLNAADEVAVDNFINGKINFSQIPIIIEKMLERHNIIKNVKLDVIIEVDTEIRRKTQEYINSI